MNKKLRISGSFMMAWVFLALLLAGCKTTRTVYKAPLKEEGPEFLVNQLKEHQFTFNAFTAKYNASYTSNKQSADFSGQLRMIKDSAIWISISPTLGIEIIRLLVTRDSVKYLNRFDKIYYSGDYSILHHFLDAEIDFDILQALILGNDFEFYDNTSFRASVDNMEYRLSTTGRRKIVKEVTQQTDNDPVILVQNIWLNPDNFKITKVDLKEYQKDNKNLLAEYSDFEQVGARLFPSRVSYEIQANDQLGMQIKYNRISLDPDVRFPFSIPDRYTRIR